MVKVRQRFPNYVEGFPPQFGTFSNEAELKEIPFIKNIWLDDKFKQFFVVPMRYCKDAEYKAYLIVEQTNGSLWSVGYLDCIPDFLPLYEGDSI